MSHNLHVVMTESSLGYQLSNYMHQI